MAKKKGKKKKTAKRTPRFALPDIDWDRWGRLASGGAWFVGSIGIVIGAVIAVPRLEAYASDATWAESVEVTFVDAPAWAEGDLDAWLARVVLGEISGDALRRDDLVAAGHALMETGCFEAIEQVRRASPVEIQVTARFILPHAIIRDADGDHLIDRRGRLLPGSYIAPEHHGFMVFVGTTFDRPATPGEEWPGSDVTAALELLTLIDTRPWRGQVQGIDLSSYHSSDRIELVTDRASRIIWGSAPGDEGAREVPASTKLGYLDRLYRDYRHIDRGVELISVEGDTVTAIGP